MTGRFNYATGYKSRAAAEIALENMIPDEISEGEHPIIRLYYEARTNAKRYAIEIDG